MKNFEPACILRRTFAHTSLPVLACLLMCWKWEHPLSKRSLHHHVSLWNDSVLVKFASGAPKTPQWISTCKARCTLTCDCWSLAGHTKNARLGYGPGQLQFTLLQAGLVELDDLRPAGRGTTGGTCNKFMSQHHLVCEPAFGLVQKTTLATSICMGASILDPTQFTQ